MTLFVIIPTGDATKIIEEVAKLAPDNYFLLPKGEVIIKYQGTTQELSNALGITEGVSGTAVIFSIGAYYGRAPTNIWEWIKTRWA